MPSEAELADRLAAELGEGRMVEAAYRLAAKNLHPDTGGTTAEFQRLQEAKRVLEGAIP